MLVTEETLAKLMLAGYTTTMLVLVTLIVGHREADRQTWSVHKAYSSMFINFSVFKNSFCTTNSVARGLM